MPIIKKSNEKLILWRKSFPIVPMGYLAIDLGIKQPAFSVLAKKVPSLDFCCIIILMDNLAYLATNFYERDEHKPIEKFCTLCAVKGGGGRRSEAQRNASFQDRQFFTARRCNSSAFCASQPFADCLTPFCPNQATLTKSNGLKIKQFIQDSQVLLSKFWMT